MSSHFPHLLFSLPLSLRVFQPCPAPLSFLSVGAAGRRGSGRGGRGSPVDSTSSSLRLWPGLALRATGVMPFWSLRSTHASCVQISTASFLLAVVLHWWEPDAVGGACSVTPLNKLEGSLVVALDLLFPWLFSCCCGGGREEKGRTRLSCQQTCSVRPNCPQIWKKTSCVQLEKDEGDPELTRRGFRKSYGAQAGWPSHPTIWRIFRPNGGHVSFLPALKPEGEAVLLQQGFCGAICGGHAVPSGSSPALASILRGAAGTRLRFSCAVWGLFH